MLNRNHPEVFFSFMGDKSSLKWSDKDINTAWKSGPLWPKTKPLALQHKHSAFDSSHFHWNRKKNVKKIWTKHETNLVSLKIFKTLIPKIYHIFTYYSTFSRLLNSSCCFCFHSFFAFMRFSCPSLKIQLHNYLSFIWVAFTKIFTKLDLLNRLVSRLQLSLDLRSRWHSLLVCGSWEANTRHRKLRPTRTSSYKGIESLNDDWNSKKRL